MQQQTRKRLLVVALLAGGLAVAAPSQVHAAPFEGPQAVWKWLARVWGDGVAVLWEGRGGKSIHENAGGCIDPNGACVPRPAVCPPNGCATSAGGPTCHAWNDAGGCIDPNG